MENSANYLNSVETANLLGVNVSTIKRWTDDGRLKCQKTAGGHRKFSMVHISDFIEKNFNKQIASNLYPVESERDIEVQFRIIKGDFEFLVTYLTQQALRGNRSRIENVLKGLYLAGHPLFKIYDAVTTPLLQNIGTEWLEGRITVFEEHIVSQSIKDSMERLQGIVNKPAFSLGPVFLFTPEKELHDIGLKMADHILEHRGFNIVYSGPNTPLEEIEKMVRRFKPIRLYVSVTIVSDRLKLENDMDNLKTLAEKYNLKVFVGGRGFDVLDIEYSDNFRRLENFEDLNII